MRAEDVAVGTGMRDAVSCFASEPVSRRPTSETLLQIGDLIDAQLAETHVTPVDTQGTEQG